MKEKILKFFSLLKNKRYRAVFIILLYFVFFGVMFLILSLVNSNKSVPKINNEKKYKDYNNYLFFVDLNIDDIEYSFFGKRYENSYEINYNDKSFNFKFGDEIDLDSNVYESLNFDPIFNNELIENSKLVSETKMVDDNIVEKNYNLGVCRYGKITDLNIENCDENLKIIINVGYKNGNLIYVKINMDDLFNLISDIKKYNIMIRYEDVDSVLRF